MIAANSYSQDGHHERCESTNKSKYLIEGLGRVSEHSYGRVHTQPYFRYSSVCQSRSIVKRSCLNSRSQLRERKAVET
jgi:hypothetical protein